MKNKLYALKRKGLCPLNFKVLRLMRMCPRGAWMNRERKEMRCALGTVDLSFPKVLCLDKATEFSKNKATGKLWAYASHPEP